MTRVRLVQLATQGHRALATLVQQAYEVKLDRPAQTVDLLAHKVVWVQKVTLVPLGLLATMVILVQLVQVWDRPVLLAQLALLVTTAVLVQLVCAGKLVQLVH